MREPQIHSHVSDTLPEDHPLAYKMVDCNYTTGPDLLHAANNECMKTWVETGKGNFCLRHFMMMLDAEEGLDVLEDDWGLPDQLCENGNTGES